MEWNRKRKRRLSVEKQRGTNRRAPRRRTEKKASRLRSSWQPVESSLRNTPVVHLSSRNCQFLKGVQSEWNVRLGGWQSDYRRIASTSAIYTHTGCVHLAHRRLDAHSGAIRMDCTAASVNNRLGHCSVSSSYRELAFRLLQFQLSVKLNGRWKRTEVLVLVAR